MKVFQLIGYCEAEEFLDTSGADEFGEVYIQTDDLTSLDFDQLIKDHSWTINRNLRLKSNRLIPIFYTGPLECLREFLKIAPDCVSLPDKVAITVKL